MRWIALLAMSWAQDTGRVMAYNLLYYGSTPGYCNTSCKDRQLRTIVGYIRPHIIGFNEIAPSAGYFRRLLDSVLNIGGITYWRSSQYANPSNSNIVSGLFYDSRRWEWIRQDLVTNQGGLRDVYAYHLYYKEPWLSSGEDTLFLVVIVSHLKAGDTPADQQARSQAAAAIRQYIANLPPARRRFVIEMGDHNLYADTEPAYQTLIQTMVDPGPAGPWSDNPAYAFFHTQSTRLQRLADGGVGGGLNDRFDFIFFSPECTTATARARYIPGSFRVIGQDGQHFRRALIDQPLPTGYPPDLINALYVMSDHLPVVADFALSVRLSSAHLDRPEAYHPFSWRLDGNKLYLFAHQPCVIEIWDVLGRLVSWQQFMAGETKAEELPHGVYMLRSGQYVQKLLYLP